MTFDTFESLNIGDKVVAEGKKRSYPVVRIGENSSNRRVVYVCINPLAVKIRGDAVAEFGIFSSSYLGAANHYLNWNLVRK